MNKQKVKTMMRRNSSLGSVGFSARGGRSRRRHGGSSKLPYLILIGILIVLLGIAAFLWVRRSPAEHVSSVPASTETDSENGVISLDNASAPADDSLEGVIAQAKLLADGYDYDGAINLLSSSTYASDESVTAAIDEYNATKETLVRADPRKVTHVFFHTLIMDTSKAFDGDSREKGYNQVMTTKDEFMKILQSMYERGFVLVRLHDVAYEVTAEDGSRYFQEGDIMLPEGKKPYVIMVVGVNGVGKTTTIGKLAYQFKKAGKTVYLGAADTFRAAAVEQLDIWGERVGVPVIKQKMGSDPASVAFDTLSSAVANNADVVIIDTAGRLHNKVGLMNELTKIKNVMKKVVADAPHEVLLVLDGSTGQNAFEQAKQFTLATEVTAMAITKLDGTAKGGVVIGISEQFKIPVKYIGLGEGIEDMQVFRKKEFVDSLFGETE